MVKRLRGFACLDEIATLVEADATDGQAAAARCVELRRQALRLPQGAETAAAQRAQRRPIARFDNPSSFNYVNQIGPSDGREAMRDQDDRELAAPALDRFEHASLVFGIETVGRLVQNEHRRTSKKCACQRQPLALALRHQNSAITNDGIESVA